MSLEGMVILGAGAVTAFATSRPVIAGLGVIGWVIVGSTRASATKDPVGLAAEAVLRRIREAPDAMRELLAGVEAQVHALCGSAASLARRRVALQRAGLRDEDLARVDAQLTDIHAALESALAKVVRVTVAASEDDGLEDSLDSLARELESLDRTVEEVWGKSKRREER